MHLRPWDSYKKVIQKWGKIVLPQKLLRFYPPSFIIRDTIVEGVDKCFQQGHQAAVIVFNHANLDELIQTSDIYDVKMYKSILKEEFLQAARNVFPDHSIVSLHKHLNNGHALIIKVEHDKDRFFEIETLMNEILSKVLVKLSNEYKEVVFMFETGYMFIEQKESSTREAILKAYQQANSMAEKKTFSQYNELRFEMNRIIHQKDLRLMAQPIFDVATNKTTASEILTRGPVGTDLENPLQLFAVARQLNLLFDLEIIVLEKAFEQIIKFEREHQIFINFTPITLSNPGFIKVVNRMLLKYRNVNPYQVIFEITERDSIEGFKHFSENIKSLRKMGFRIAIDDTGAGYSSLHTISEVLPDIIKIDRSVIQDIDTNTVKESMLRGLLLIAKETGSIVVAEGIEKEGEASVLSRNNVDLAQGYFYARPAMMPSLVSTL
ncbi:EAL domain-containing protein (putative c-di-GMP-specific phosphodiesterase class I) [Bacillus mesophilus]|uniref:EAL domain-containing protein n=1 Tax=Bacillus mesophilus TaxID=1808955 RepID=A0A6M0Q998_9BACI|nr:EAL domain-containing protein [Bacillus mesophilus]MBM7661428.1 EAL domain-containing protein (putative c-di-GMP-specific phosphodiesterase class I) [Bacillus mesophilus]NEY72100.1 EAL domain-containing protein [Bacillus mesophilus]